MGKRSTILVAAVALLASTAAQAVTTTVSAVLDRPYVFPDRRIGSRNITPSI